VRLTSETVASGTTAPCWSSTTTMSDDVFGDCANVGAASAQHSNVHIKRLDDGIGSLLVSWFTPAAS
jgi:hypothetical protein